MYKILKLFLVLSISSNVLFIQNTLAKILNSSSGSYYDVQLAVSQANSGDTIVVPADTVVWDNVLSITKGIMLKGAGIGETVIRARRRTEKGVTGLYVRTHVPTLESNTPVVIEEGLDT